MIRILLIEDDEHIAQSIQFFLEGEGFQIKVAAMARQAMELLKSEDFQLVILDVTLPDGNGFELFEEIKARKELPVIFLTALDGEEEIVKGFELGADEYITKPFRPRELLSRIRNVIRHTGILEENRQEIQIEHVKMNLEQGAVYKNNERIELTALELKQELWGLVIVAAGFALLARRVVLSVDWTLLLVFMAMFIDVHLLTQLPVLQGVLSNVSHLSEPGLWLTAIGLSQVISNVPSTILLLNYVPPSLLLAWAVNVGGFGLLPGSLANLIALRMANDRRIWWRFHLYSIPMLLWAALVGYVLLVMIPAG